MNTIGESSLEVNDNTPHRNSCSSDETDEANRELGLTSQDFTPSPSQDAEDTVDDSCQNPEPPQELVELIDADNIGDTVFSKHWLFSTLMRLLQVVEQQENHDAKEGTDSTTSNVCFDLDDDLQDNLCKLWDMSMNQEVVNFLVEFKAIELLSGVIGNSRAPRATEICVGILGNMACTPSVCEDMSSNRKFLDLLLSLLESPDAPTLVEVTRLYRVCISSDSVSAAFWITAIKETAHVFQSVLFILQSSTNAVLLKNTAEFVDKLMETDEDICKLWGTADLVLAVMEAVKQTGYKENDECETFIHLLQLVSTSEFGVQALVTYAGEVFMLIMHYLVHICVDDIVAVNDHLNIISSSFSVLVAVFASWDAIENYLISDFQLLRCIAKILEVVYPKMKYNTTNNILTPRKRSCSRTISEEHRQEYCARNSHLTSASSETSTKEHETVGKGYELVTENNVQVPASDSSCGDQTSTTNSDEKSAADKYNSKMTSILYEVIQNLLVDVVSTLDKLPVADPYSDSASGVVNGEHSGTGVADETAASSTTANQDVTESTSKETPPKTLTYLNSQCDRYRLQCLLHTLNDVEDKQLASTLFSVALRHGLNRLCRIIKDTVPSLFSI